MPAIVENRDFNTAREFIDFFVHEVERGALFRGQRDSSWTLKPSVWRDGTLNFTKGLLRHALGENWFYRLAQFNRDGPKALAERYLGNDSDESVERIRSLVVCLESEKFLIEVFANSCGRMALPVPGMTTPEFREPLREQSMPVDGRRGLLVARRQVPYFEPNSTYALAQHMRIPTRLLDFSENPLKAAFFAIDELPGVQAVDHRIAVWVAREPHPNEALHWDDTPRIFRALRSEIAFLHAQDGLFLSCNIAANMYFLNTGSWPTFEDLLDGWQLKKVTVPAAEALNLRRVLDRLGVTRTSMMPSFQDAAAEVRAVLQRT